MTYIPLKDLTPTDRWHIYWLAVVPIALFWGVLIGIALYFSAKPGTAHPVYAGVSIASYFAGSFALIFWAIQGGWRHSALLAIILGVNCYYYGWHSWMSIVLYCALVYELFRLILKADPQPSSDNDDTQI